MEALQYAQAVARIRVLETRLLDRPFLERLIDTGDPIHALKLLQDKGYSPHLADLSQSETFEEALDEMLVDLYQEVSRLSPEPKVTDLMALAYDYYHLKLLLKNRFQGIPTERLCLGLGTIPVAKMSRDLASGDLRDFPGMMRETIERVQEKLEQTQDPLWIDLLLDRACCRQMSATADFFASELISQVIMRRIDLVNLVSWMRCQRLKKGREWLKEYWLEGGCLDLELFQRLFQESLDTLVSRLSHTDYGTLIRKCLEETTTERQMLCLEKEGQSLVLDDLNAARRIPFGPEPLLAYLLAREAEIRNVRLVLLGLQQRLPPERIRERMGALYG